MRPSTAPNADRIEALERAMEKLVPQVTRAFKLIERLASLEQPYIREYSPETAKIIEGNLGPDHETKACSNARNHRPHAWRYSMANGGGELLCPGITGADV